MYFRDVRTNRSMMSSSSPHQAKHLPFALCLIAHSGIPPQLKFARRHLRGPCCSLRLLPELLPPDFHHISPSAHTIPRHKRRALNLSKNTGYLHGLGGIFSKSGLFIYNKIDIICIQLQFTKQGQLQSVSVLVHNP